MTFDDLTNTQLAFLALMSSGIVYFVFIMVALAKDRHDAQMPRRSSFLDRPP